MTEINREWNSLYKIAAVTTSMMIILVPVQILVFLLSPPPASAAGFLDLFVQSPVKGLLSLDLLYIINSILIIPMYLAFYASLKNVNKSLLVLALTAGFIGLAAYFSSNTAFEMLILSQKFSAAATEAQRQSLIAAAESVLAIYTGTSFNVYYILNAITLLLIAGTMLKSQDYSRLTAVIGIISGIFMIIPSTAGTIGLVFSLLSLVPWVVFSIMVVKQFVYLSKT